MLLQVDKTQVDDLAYCKTAMLGFQSFIAQFEGQSLYTRRDLDFKNVTATITDLIYFVTISDILDPILREGLPHPSRQLLLREQQVLDRAMECIQVPFKHHYKFSELSSEKARNKPSVKPLHRMGVLCQRLARHILRENTANKIYAMRFVPSLQGQLGYGLRAAGTLTEVFADNEQLLDKVTDARTSPFTPRRRSIHTSPPCPLHR